MMCVWQNYMCNYTYTYLFFILCIELHVAQMQSKFFLRLSAPRQRLRRPGPDNVNIIPVPCFMP